MSAGCLELRAQLMAHLAGELEPLRAALLERHLARCRACAGVRAELAASLAAARAYEPQLDPGHLARLNARFAAPPAPRRSWWLLPVPAAAAALALLLVSLEQSPAPRPQPAADPLSLLADRPGEAQPAPRPPPAPALRRERLGRHGRMLSTADYAGVLVARDPRRLVLKVERGLALVDFRGGSGRELLVEVDQLRLQVRSTRFFVEVSRAGPPRIGVLSGQADLRSAEGTTTLGPGSTVSLGPAGLTAALEPPLVDTLKDDPFLALVTEEPAATAVTSTGTSALERLDRAEALLREGRPEEARRLYRALARAAAPGIQRVARFELARLDGDRGALRALAEEADDPPGVEAALQLCEQERAQDPCRGAPCLAAWAEDPARGPALRGAARALHAEWIARDGERCSQRAWTALR